MHRRKPHGTDVFVLDRDMAQKVVKRRRSSVALSYSDEPSAEPRSSGDEFVNEILRFLQAPTVAQVDQPRLEGKDDEGNNEVDYTSPEACKNGFSSRSALNHMCVWMTIIMIRKSTLYNLLWIARYCLTRTSSNVTKALMKVILLFMSHSLPSTNGRMRCLPGRA